MHVLAKSPKFLYQLHSTYGNQHRGICLFGCLARPSSVDTCICVSLSDLHLKDLLMHYESNKFKLETMLPFLLCIAYLFSAVDSVNHDEPLFPINHPLLQGDDVSDTAHTTALFACDTMSMRGLPFDIRSSMTQYLEREDMKSLIRSSKSNSYSCRQYINKLLSLKFAYLLHHNESKINIKHLMNIPLIDSITINSTKMPFYFVKRNESEMSSQYIGIDKISGNGFISFWMKRVQPQLHRWKIITILFNETDGPRVYTTDTSYRSTLKNPLKCRCNVAALNHLMLMGKMKGILEDRGTWFLNHKWNV